MELEKKEEKMVQRWGETKGRRSESLKTKLSFSIAVLTFTYGLIFFLLRFIALNWFPDYIIYFAVLEFTAGIAFLLAAMFSFFSIIPINWMILIVSLLFLFNWKYLKLNLNIS